MVQVLARNWWALLIRGFAAFIFGMLAFLWPGVTILFVGILFGAYAFVDGIFAIVVAARTAQRHERWWPFLIEGIVGIVIAGITFYDVRITLLALYFTIAAWAIITGVLELIASFHLRKEIANEIWLMLGGMASIIFGVLMVIFPLAGALVVIWLIAGYALVFGILMMALAFRIRNHGAATPTPATT